MFSDSDSEEEGLISETLRRLKNRGLFSQDLFFLSQTASPPASQRNGRLSLRRTRPDAETLQDGPLSDLTPVTQPGAQSSSTAALSLQPGRHGISVSKVSSDKESAPSGDTVSDSTSSQDLDLPVMPSLCGGNGRKVGQSRDALASRQRASGMESVDSSEDMVIAETSEEDLDKQAECTLVERNIPPPSVPNPSSDTTLGRGHGTTSLHLPSPISQASTPGPAPVHRCYIQTMRKREYLKLDEDDEDSDEDYYDYKKPGNTAPLHSTPVSMHTAAASDQQTGRPLSRNEDSDHEEDCALPELTFSSKRKQKNENQSHGLSVKRRAVPGISQKAEKRPVAAVTTVVQSGESKTSEGVQSKQGMAPGTEQPRQGMPKQSLAEAYSSDADIESVSSDIEENDDLQFHKTDELSTSSRKGVKSDADAVSGKKTLQQEMEMTPRESSERDTTGEVTEHADATTLVYEESTMEYSQLSPSILEQETELINEARRTENTDNIPRIVHVVSLNPNAYSAQHEDREPILQTMAREFHDSSGTHLLHTENCDSPAVIDSRVTLPRLKSEDSDMTQPYDIPDTQGSQGPPLLSTVSSIPSMLGRQVSRDSLPPPLLTKVSTNLIPDSYMSVVERDTWPALSCSALEKLKTEDKDSDAEGCVPETQPVPLSGMKEEGHLQPKTLSVTVPLLQNDCSPPVSQDRASEQTGLPSHVTVSVRLPANVCGNGNILPSTGSEENTQSQEYPVLLPVKQETVLAMSEPDVADAGSDESQCLFDDLPVRPADQEQGLSDAISGTGDSPTMVAEVYMSDADEEIPIELLVKGKVADSLTQQQEHSADQNDASVSGQQPELGDSEVIADAKAETRASDSSLTTQGTHEDISRSDTVALVKEEPVSYTLDEDYVTIFDSDEEEMFASFTQMEVTRDGAEDNEEKDLWSDEITDQELLEVDIKTGPENDGLTDDSDDEDSRDSAINSNIEAHKEKILSVYSQATLVDERYEDVSTDDDIYLIDTQIDESSDISMSEIKTGKAASYEDVYSHETQVDNDGLQDSDLDTDKNLSLKPLSEESEHQDADKDKSSNSEFDDEMDDVLYAAATQIDDGMEAAVSHSPSEVEETSIVPSLNNKLEKECLTESPMDTESQQRTDSATTRLCADPSSKSGSLSPNIHSGVIDLTVESSNEQTVREDCLKNEAVKEEERSESDENSSGMGVEMNIFSGIFNEPTLVVSDSENDASPRTCSADPEGKSIYDVQTLADDEEDFYSMATQRDEDPYLAQTQVDREPVLVSEESDQDNIEEKSDGSEKESADGNACENVSKTKTAQRDLSMPVSGISITKMSTTTRRRSADSSTEYQPSGSGGPQKKAKGNSAEDEPGRKSMVENDQEKSLIRISRRDTPSVSRTLESARETMRKINKKNLKGSVIEIEPQPEAKRRGKKPGLQQKLCNLDGPKSLPSKEPLDQRDSGSSVTDSEHPVEGIREQQRGTYACPVSAKQQLSDTGTCLATEWLKKKPAKPNLGTKQSMAKTPKVRKRKNMPGTPNISEYAKKARRELRARQMKAIINPSLVRAGRRHEPTPENDPAMDMDVELPSTQEVFEKGLPLMTACVPVSKQRLRRLERREEDSSSESVVDKARAEGDVHHMNSDPSSQSQKQRASCSYSSSEMKSKQSRDFSSVNLPEPHSESRHSGSKVSTELSRTPQDSSDQGELVGKPAAKRRKTEDDDREHDKVQRASNEKHGDSLLPESSSGTGKPAHPSVSTDKANKDISSQGDKEHREKYHDKRHTDRHASSKRKHREDTQTESSGKKHSISSQSGTSKEKSGVCSKAGSEVKKDSDGSRLKSGLRKHGDHSRSGSGGSSKSRPSDKQHSSSSEHSRVDNVEGNRNSTSRSGSTETEQDPDIRKEHVERKQNGDASSESGIVSGNTAALLCKLGKRPPTPPRTKEDDVSERAGAGDDDNKMSSASENRRPDAQPSTKRKTVRFALELNKVLEFSRTPPQPLPTFQEMLSQKRPASAAQPRPPFFQGNPLQKRLAPLQEQQQQQQQQQQYVFKPLVPSSGRTCVAGPSGQENSHGGQRLLDVGDFVWHVLGWSSLWFMQYEKYLENATGLSPDALKPPPVVDFKQLYPLVTTYGDRIEEYQAIFFKLLLLETWEELFKSWKEKKKKKVPPCHVFLSETMAQQTRQSTISLGWTGLLTNKELNLRQYPVEGDMVVMDMGGHFMPSGAPGQSSGGEQPFSQLAHVEKTHFTKCPDLHGFMASNPALRSHPALKQGDRDLWVYKVWVKIRYRRFAPSKNFPTVITPVGSLTSSFRRYQALQILPRCPLMRDVLNPTAMAADVHFLMPAALVGETLFNKEQNQAIETMLNAALEPAHKPKMCLLKGPPGTGKSSVLVELIMKMLQKKKDARICLCAPSNAAVDELLRRLVKKKKNNRLMMSVVRIGNVDSIHTEVKEYALENIFRRAKENALQKMKIETMPESVKSEHKRLTKKMAKLKEDIDKCTAEKDFRQVDTLTKEMRKLQKEKSVIEKGQEHMTLTPRQAADIYAHELKQAQVVCGTLSSFGQPRIVNILRHNRSLNHFTCVIIDEATQATELDSLIPLQYGVTKLFLVGDPDQLPPTILSTKAQSLNFGMSLFERLHKHHTDQEEGDRSVLMLRTQYRMDPAICSFPNHLVYGGQLRTDRKIEEYCQKHPLRPYIVFDVEEGQEMLSQSGTLSNEVEADCTAVLCQELIQHKLIMAQSIGIICPYAGQKRLVINKLREKDIREVEVNTVDGFQGREKHIIILSCVRARNPAGGIGFLSDRRRMNVALTRAKYALYIIGHFQSLSTDGDWKSLIRDAEDRKVTQQVHSVLEFPAIIRQRCFKRPVTENSR